MDFQTKTKRFLCAKRHMYVHDNSNRWHLLVRCAHTNIQVRMQHFHVVHFVRTAYHTRRLHFHQYFVSPFLIFCWFTHMGAYIYTHARINTEYIFFSLSAPLFILCSKYSPQKLSLSLALCGRLYVVFVYITLCTTQWFSLSRALSISVSLSLSFSLSLALCASLVVVATASTVVFVSFPLFCILAMRLLFCRLSCQYLQ